MQVLRQLQHLQEALWRHAVTPAPATPDPTLVFSLPTAAAVGGAEEPDPIAVMRPRMRRHTRGPDRYRARQARTDHVRPDLFTGEWDTIDAWLAAQPEQPSPPLRPDAPRPASRPGSERQRAETPDGLSTGERANSRHVRSIICAACGASETVIRGERGPLTAYCDACRAERKRDQARQRMVLLRARRRSGAPAGE